MNKIIFFIVLIPLCIRVLLPFSLKYYFNHQLNKDLTQYKLHIDDIDLSFLKGRIDFQNLTISKNKALSEDDLFFKIRELQFDLNYQIMLRDQKLIFDLSLYNPELFFRDSEKKEEVQLGHEEPLGNWQKTISNFIPTTISQLIVKDGKLHFEHLGLEVKQPLLVDKIKIEIKNLNNTNPNALTHLNITGNIQNHSKLSISGDLALLTKPIHHSLDFSLEKLKLTSINKVLMKYIPVDFTRGHLSLYSEIHRVDKWEGYLRLFLEDVDVISKDQDYKSSRHFFFEVVISLANWFLENQANGNVAIETSFEDEKGDLKLDYSEAFWSSLENKFESLRRGILNKFDLQN